MKWTLLQLGTAPGVSTLYLPDQMLPHVTRSPRPSLSVFAYGKQSRTGGIEGLGMRLGKLGEQQLSYSCLLSTIATTVPI